jgi:hypothetical protein
MLLFGELRQVPPIYSPVSNQNCNKLNYFTYTSLLIILTYANKYKSLICNNSVTTTVSQQQCHNNSATTTVSQQQCHNNSVTTTVSQLKICDFSGENFKGFEELQFSMSATTTQLLSSGKFYKLRYDTEPVKSASTNVSFIPIIQKFQNCEL